MSNQEKAIAVVERLNDEYERAVDALRTALRAYLENGTRPDPQARFDGTFAYPELRLTYDPEALPPKLARSYARVSRPGVYSTTVTKPAQFKDYLVEQLTLLMDDFDVEIEVERSRQEIPYPYVLDATIDLNQADVRSQYIARFFPTTDLAFIGDEIADGVWDPTLEETRPLSLFDGLRTDFSLARLKHYTGAPAEDVQQFILFTNYHRYVDEFVRWGIEQLKKPDSPYTGLSCAGGLMLTANTVNP